MDKQIKRKPIDNFNRLLYKEDLLHHSRNTKQPAGSLSETEVNIVLIIILFLIILLFWVPLSEVIV